MELWVKQLAWLKKEQKQLQHAYDPTWDIWQVRRHQQDLQQLARRIQKLERVVEGGYFSSFCVVCRLPVDTSSDARAVEIAIENIEGSRKLIFSPVGRCCAECRTQIASLPASARNSVEIRPFNTILKTTYTVYNIHQSAIFLIRNVLIKG